MLNVIIVSDSSDLSLKDGEERRHLGREFIAAGNIVYRCSLFQRFNSKYFWTSGAWFKHKAGVTVEHELRFKLSHR